MFDYVGFLYDRFGVRDIAHAELATRPDNKLGTDEDWDRSEGILREAVERQGIPYRVAEGEGAFYGPKIDFFMNDAMGRPWQMGTIQLDGQQPARLGCTYMGPDNREHMPYVIHRALFGSLERFIGILIEHYAGAFPFWLAPVQVRVIPVGDGHREAAERARRGSPDFRVDVDEPDETVGRRIRDAELEKVPKVVVYGDRSPRPPRRPRPGRRPVHGEPRCDFARRGSLLPSSLKAGADPFLTSRAMSPPGFNRVDRRGSRAAACAVSSSKRRKQRLGDSP